MPNKLGNIENNVLIPMKAWSSKEDYVKTAETLVEKFQNNFADYNIEDENIRNAGPKKS